MPNAPAEAQRVNVRYGAEALGPSQINDIGIFVTYFETVPGLMGPRIEQRFARVVDMSRRDPRLSGGFWAPCQWDLNRNAPTEELEQSGGRDQTGELPSVSKK